MSKQIGITRTTTSPDKSNNVNAVMQHKTDYKGISVLVVSAGLFYLVFWLLAIGIAAIRCATSDALVCYDTSYVFYIGLALPIILGIGVLIPTIVQAVTNMSYRPFSGILMHRDDVRTNATQLIPVAHRYAESLATSGADNYAPSWSDSHNGGNTTNNSNETNAANTAAVANEPIPLDLLDTL